MYYKSSLVFLLFSLMFDKCSSCSTITMHFTRSLSLLMASLAPVLATISDEQYNQLVEMASWAKIAYCTADLTFQVGALPQECPLMEFCEEHTTVELVSVVRPNIAELEISGSAYVAVDETNKKVYTVFRGSLSPGDFLTDVTFEQCDYVPYVGSNITAEKLVSAGDTDMDAVNQVLNDNGDSEACDGCKVHCGVYIAYTQFMAGIFESAQPYLEDGYELTVTGHSLAGGYSLLAALDFKLQGYNPLLINYASLMVGNPAFNTFVDEVFETASKNASVAAGNALEYGTFARVYEASDLVPRLPPGDYTHSGLQFEITSSTLTQTADEVDYKGPTDDNVNSPYDFDFTDILNYFIILQHLNYFTRLSWPCTDAFNIKA